MLRLGDASLDVLPAPLARPWGRTRERRAALARVLGSLAEHLRSGREAPTLAACFESALTEALRAQAVRLRESAPPYRSDGAPSSKTHRLISIDVPTRRGAPPVVVEATLDSELSLDAWDIQMLQAAAQLAALVVELDQLRAAPRRPFGVTRRPDSGTPPIIGSSSAMTTLRENIARVAATDFTVLVQGESGTGKELVARQLHQLGRRRCGPFIAVNCAALVESLLEAELFGIEDRTATGVRGRRGKFEHADGGTLFLDEVSDLAPAAQAKLLRAIQELVVERVGGHVSRRVDTRIIVATNKDLRELAAGGQFREDLFYRLSGVELHVPPLRARRQDIPELSAYFLSRYQTRRPLTLSAEASEAMQIYDWPGNVRELERLIEGAVTLAASEWVTIGDLPPALRGDCAEALGLSLKRSDTMRAWGARYARLVFDRCQQNKRRACEALDISYHTLMAYLEYGPDGGGARRHRVAWADAAGDEAGASTSGETDGAGEPPV
jgi:two-component system, NtrC family, response regulator HydG